MPNSLLPVKYIVYSGSKVKLFDSNKKEIVSTVSENALKQAEDSAVVIIKSLKNDSRIFASTNNIFIENSLIKGAKSKIITAFKSIANFLFAEKEATVREGSRINKVFLDDTVRKPGLVRLIDSTVTSIEFASGKGTVYIDNKSRILDKVTGGEIKIEKHSDFEKGIKGSRFDKLG